MFVDLSQKKIVVVGAGKIAARRVRTLLQFAEHILVISPEFCEEIRTLDKEQRVECLEKPFEEMDIADADIVLAATNRREVNSRVVSYCKEHHIPVNTADQKSECDFYFPSVICKENIVIGIGSGGTSPGKVRSVREEMEKAING